MKLRKWIPWIAVLTLGGCAGTLRSCSNWSAETYGADWVVAQMAFDGKPARCWILHGVSVTNEDQSDGIHWLGRDGDLVHVAGWIDRVQVSSENFERAGKQIGVTDINSCIK